jgi:hypothetical protein
MLKIGLPLAELSQRTLLSLKIDFGRMYGRALHDKHMKAASAINQAIRDIEQNLHARDLRRRGDA